MFEFSLYFKIPFSDSRLNIGIKEEPPLKIVTFGQPTLKGDFKKPPLGPPPAFVLEKALEKITSLEKEKAKLEVLRDTQKDRLDLLCDMLNRHGIETPDRSISGVHAAMESGLKEWQYLRASFDQIIDDLKHTAGFEDTETDDEAYLAFREILEGLSK